MISKLLVPSLGFNVKSKIDSSWSTSKHRMLVVLQTVPEEDLDSRELCSGDAWARVLAYSVAHAEKYKRTPRFAYAITNFNDKRHLHLRGHAQAAAEGEFRTRLQAIIKTLNPTHIFFAGAVDKLYSIPHASLKNGWVHEIEGRKVVSSLDYARLIESKGTSANLLGLFTRHLANAHLGYQPHNLAAVESKPRLVDTISKFDKFLARLHSTQRTAYDTETKSLFSYNNPIYTMQFCMEENPDVGYIVPLHHPHESNPFSQKERAYISGAMREFFGAKEGPELITINGAFDLRVTRREFDLDIIYHPVWEITAGEHSLDENIQELVGFQCSIRGLGNLLCSYGNDFYQVAPFSKSDRSNIGQTSLDDQGALEYMAMDVISLQHIRREQIERASKQELNGKPYGKYFVRHMRHQMDSTEHTLSHLKDTGSRIDVPYLRKQLRPDSELAVAIQELGEEFRTLPQAKVANEQLLEDEGFKAKGLFGKSSAAQWVLALTKPAHKRKLFFDVMKLRPVSKTESGEPAVDKDFIAHYKDRNYVVELFGEFQEASKLLSTYLRGWYKRLRSHPDALEDSHMRADFVFFQVATGRLASMEPNLQNIPSRGKLAKLIKAMFMTRDGHLQIRYDYSAHEVRGWSIVSGDKVLASAFREGQRLRQQWIKNPTPEVLQELKKKGDLHIQNVYRFFKRWIEKSDPLRDAIKSIVFGVLYGKSAETLGHDTKKAELDTIKKKLGEAYKAKDKDTPAAKRAIAKLEAEFQALLDEDRTEYAQSIIDKMFHEFQSGHAWIKKMQRMATEKLYVYSPIGRIRHLYAGMTGDRATIRRQVRQGMNAPIQGFASEIAVKAARHTAVEYYGTALPKLKKMLRLKGRFTVFMNRIVHDASYYTVPYEMVLPFIHLLQWTTTYGVARLYKEQFGLTFTVEPEIEVEVGVRDTLSYKWDWSLTNLNSIIAQSVKDGIEQGLLTEDYESIMRKIYEPWLNAESRKYLNETYPLLNVDLLREIEDAAKSAVSALDK